MPPDHWPLRRAAAILSRVRSEMISRSNWAKDNRTLRTNRPIDVAVLNCWVTETKAKRSAKHEAAPQSPRQGAQTNSTRPDAAAMLNGKPVEISKIEVSMGAVAKCLCNGELLEIMTTI